MFYKKTFSTLKLKILIIVLISILLSTIFLTPRFLTNILTDLRIYTCQITLDRHELKIFVKINNFLEGTKLFILNGCKYPILKIDTKFSNLLKLRKNRDFALKNNSLIKSKNIFVPAKATWENNDYDIKMKLKGARIDHVYQNKKWSLKIEVKKNKSINSFQEFSITKPSSRQFPDSVFFSNILRNYEIKTPKFLMVNLIFNGENWGPMLIEEHYSSSYKELKQLRDVPIMTLSDGSNIEISSYFEGLLNNNDIGDFNKFTAHKRKILTDTYNLNKYIKKNDQNSFNLISLIKTIHEITHTKKNLNTDYLKKYFNLKQIGLIMANILVWGESGHSISDDNFRVYINPFTQKIEYIPTDHYIDLETSFINKNELNIDILNNAYHFSLFLNDNDLKNYYLNSLKILKEESKYHHKIITDICSTYIEICKKKFHPEKIEKNIKYLESLGTTIFKKKFNEEYNLPNPSNDKYLLLQNEIDKFDYQDLSARIYTDGTLEVFNLTPFEVKIKNISFNEMKLNIENCKSDIIKLQKIIKPEYSSNLKRNTINTNYSPCLMQKVSIKTLKNNVEKTIDLFVESEKYKVDNFYKENENKIYHYPANWTITKKNIIPPAEKIIINNPIIINNKNLLIKPGTEISFSKNSYIYLDNGNLMLDGLINKNIIFKAKNEYWGGIFVSNSDNSYIRNSTIKDTDFFNHESIMLTGGISFYQSNIDILNSKFENSVAEDGHNFVNTNFKISNSYLKNFRSDGIDSDFSKGEINNVKFDNISGDAVDLSGTEVLINNSLFNEVGDKAISNGEKSNTRVYKLLINKAKFGIANKDQSLLEGSDVRFSNSLKFDLISFNKKSYYDVPEMNLDNTVFDINKVLIMKNNKAKINSNILETAIFDPKTLY
jgi:hypothetical protein